MTRAARGGALRLAVALALGWASVLGGGALVLAADSDGGTNNSDIPLITITGDKRVVPIAVPDFKDLSALPDSQENGAKLAQILREDLAAAGFFKVLAPATYLVKPGQEGITAASVRFKDWLNTGAQLLVKVGITVTGERVRMEGHLFEVGSAKAAWPEPVVLKGDLSEGRWVTHRLANAIIKYFTGEEGVFTTRIAFTKEMRVGRSIAKNMYVVDYDGHGRRALTNNDELNMFPRFSPGGDTLYYSSSANKRWELFRHPLGGKARLFSSMAGMTALGAAPSPDGTLVAASLSQRANANVYLLDKKGRIHKQLTAARGINMSPTWSPDGKRLAFVSDRGGTPQLYVMNVDGSAPKRLTFRGNYNQEPDWSPNGKQLVFTARDERAKFDLFVVDVNDGLAVSRLTQDEGQHESGRWSPDGRQLVFTSTRSGSSQLYFMFPENRETRAVPGAGKRVLTPAWSPRPRAEQVVRIP